MEDARSIRTLPAYEEAPSYRENEQITLTLDPTGTLIKPLFKEQVDVSALYSLSSSLLESGTGGSIQVKRLDPKHPSDEAKALKVYSIGELYIQSVHSKNPFLKTVTVARNHGVLAATRPNEREWYFVTYVPYKKGEGMDGVNSGGSVGPVGAWELLGVGNGPGTWQKSLLKLSGNKWLNYLLNDDGVVVAIEGQRSKESGGMPVLTVVMELDAETMDFLISAWCVRLWGNVKRDPSRLSILLGA